MPRRFDKDVPIPPDLKRKRPSKYDFQLMEPGRDSFAEKVDEGDTVADVVARVRSAVSNFRSHHPTAAFKVRVVEGVVRCWRLADVTGEAGGKQ